MSTIDSSISKQNLISYYQNQKKHIDDELAERCFTILENVNAALSLTDNKELSIPVKQLFKEISETSVFYSQVIPDLIRFQGGVHVKYFHSNEIFMVSYVKKEIQQTIIPIEISKSDIIFDFDNNATEDFLEKAATIATDLFQKCFKFEKDSKETHKFSVKYISLYKGSKASDWIKNENYFKKILPSQLVKKNIILKFESIAPIEPNSVLVSYTYLKNEDAIQNFHPQHISTKICNEISDLLTRLKIEGQYQFFKNCMPVYEGKSKECIEKNLDYYLNILPVLLKTKKKVCVEKVTVKHILSEDKYYFSCEIVNVKEDNTIPVVVISSESDSRDSLEIENPYVKKDSQKKDEEKKSLTRTLSNLSLRTSFRFGSSRKKNERTSLIETTQNKPETAKRFSLNSTSKKKSDNKENTENLSQKNS